MKKLMFLFLIVLLLGCDSRNRSSEGNADNALEENATAEPSTSDTSSIHSDTTTSGGMNRQNPYDTLQ